MRWSNAEDVEHLALAVLERHGVSRPPVDIDLLAERDGLRWEYVPLTAAAGAYYSEGGGRGRAVINRNEHPLRQVFTKAHEYAHHLLDPATRVTIQGLPYLELPSAYRGRESHWAHDRFAAGLLMPRAWIGEYIRERGWKLERLQLIADVARRFGVSRRAAEVRLEKLGHIEGDRGASR